MIGCFIAMFELCFAVVRYVYFTWYVHNTCTMYAVDTSGYVSLLFRKLFHFSNYILPVVIGLDLF